VTLRSSRLGWSGVSLADAPESRADVATLYEHLPVIIRTTRALGLIAFACRNAAAAAAARLSVALRDER